MTRHGRGKSPIALLILLFVAASSSQSRASEPSASIEDFSPTSWDSGPIKVRVEAQTILPYLVGGALGLDAPGGFQVRTSLGSTPDLFVDAIRGVLEGSVPTFDNSLANTLFERTDGPVGWRLEMGWKPDVLRGFFASFGYSFVFMAGRFSPDDATAQLKSQFVGVTPYTVADATATIHALTTEVGFEFETAPSWMVRIALGGLFTFHSSASINVRAVENPSNEEMRANMTQTEADIQRALRTYGNIPTLSVSVGFKAL